MAALAPLVVIGAGGHGRDLAAIAEASERFRFVGFLDDDVTRPDVVGRPSERLPHGLSYVIGVNDPWQRHLLAAGLWGSAAEAAVLVHPSAVVGPGCFLGKGAVVAAGAVLDRDVSLGWHTHIHTGVTVTRSWVLPYSTLCPGVTVCGDVVIGRRALIGAGATLANLCSVGHDARVGAGATVLTGTHTPDSSTYCGTPAIPLPRHGETA